MWNTISRLFAKGSKTAVVQEEAAPPLDEEQEEPKRACNGVADDDAPADGTSAVHVFYDAAMDRGASADDRRRPAAASPAATGAAAAASADQQSSGGDSDHFSDAYESRQVSPASFFISENQKRKVKLLETTGKTYCALWGRGILWKESSAQLILDETWGM